ncbi:Upstream stimulatory factor 2 [Nymphon striatum]|nr:Upstream stimulatory factor 2 [Nymphon striatum]
MLSDGQNSVDCYVYIPTGAVTYRVVQVQGGQQAEVATASDGTTQVVTTGAFGGQQVTAQAVLASPFGNGAAEGQFYVMMSPQDVLQAGTQRTIAPRTHFTVKGTGSGTDGTRAPRDERRRATHNEVERRRRDKINTWIMKLAKIIPECTGDHSKQGQSKGGILSKACDYIQELRTANSRLPEVIKENERLSVDIELLRQQYEELKSENTFLHATLSQNGIAVERTPQT